MPGGRPRKSTGPGRPTRPQRDHSNTTQQRHDNHPSNSNDSTSDPENHDADYHDQDVICEAVTPYEQHYLAALLDLRVQRCRSCEMLILHEKEQDDESFVCKACCNNKNDANLPGNNMDPGIVPDALKDLTLVEELVISLIHPQIKVHRIKGSGQLRYSGNIISFPQDVSGFVRSLPHALESIPLLLVSKMTERDGAQRVRNFRIRGPRVLDALTWLKLNNRLYRDVTINRTILYSFPQDGNISSRLRFMADSSFQDDQVQSTSNSGEPDNDHERPESESFVPQVVNLSNESEVMGAVCLQYPSMSTSPVDEFNTPGFIPAAFPTLFPYGRPCLKADRMVKVTPKVYFTKLIRYHDGRFARHPSFRFFALNMIQRWEAIAQGNVFVKKQDIGNHTVAEIREKVKNDRSFLSKVMSYASRIPGTDSFWFKKSSELRTMIEQCGMPTVFFTLSYADLVEPDLGRILREFTGDHSSSQAKLVNENPIFVDWYFFHKVRIFFDEIVEKKYKINDSWTRFEWQFRGSPHVHGLLWIEGAPDTSFLDDREATGEENFLITQYFDHLCTAWHPNADELPAEIHPSSIRLNEVTDHEADLPQLLNRVQRHLHNRLSCIRKKPGTTTEFCRFNFPFDLTGTAVLERDPNTKRYTFLPRRNHPFLNKYNKTIMRSWRANLDIAPVTSKQALIQYVAKYTAKPENTRSETYKMLIEMVATQSNTDNVSSLIRKFICKAVGRDMSAQEVSHLLLNLPLVISSRTFETIKTSPDDWLSITHGESDDGENDASDRLSRYRQRPQRLDDLSFMSFAKKCTVYKRAGRLMYGTRKKEAVIDYWPKFKLQNGNDEAYYEQQLILHKSHRSESDLRAVSESWKSAYERHESRAGHLGINWDSVEDEGEGVTATITNDEQYLDWMSLVAAGPSGDIPDVELGRRDMDIHFDWNESFHTYPNIPLLENQAALMRQNSREACCTHPEQMPSFQLAPEQQAIVDHFKRQLNQTTDNRFVIVQGQAGSGKSAVIQALKATADSRREREFPEFACVAPTGAAAVNVGGSTIHSYFRIPTDMRRFASLKGETKRDFENQSRHLKVLIVDEYSMMRPGMIAMMSDRLQSSRGSTLPFGGVLVYLVGDSAQLVPVMAPALFSRLSQHSNIHDVRGQQMYYSLFTKVFFLQTNHRQAGHNQRAFREMLFNLSRGLNLPGIADLLNSRVRGADDDASDHCVISHTKNVVLETNCRKLEETRSPVALIEAKNIPREAETADCGLPNILQISIDSKVVLLHNLSVRNGLANGSQGYVRDIIYKPGTSSPDDMPIIIMVQFNRVLGLQSNIVPITPLLRTFMHNGQSASRLQFPLMLAWAFSTHKSQGMTLPHTLVHITNEFTPGLAYVALSRVTSLGGLLMESEISVTLLETIKKKNEAKLRELERLTRLSQ